MRPNITTPAGGGWYPSRHQDHFGTSPLSPEAQVILALALSFPTFQAPGIDGMLDFHRDMVAASKSPYRAFGKVRVKAAVAELKRLGFYGIRRASLGRSARGSSDAAPRLAFARSYGNEPFKHLKNLAGLTDDQVRAHDMAVRSACARYRRTGIWPGWGKVVSLDEHRLGRAG
jgi:hypothetical protein